MVALAGKRLLLEAETRVHARGGLWYHAGHEAATTSDFGGDAAAVELSEVCGQRAADADLGDEVFF